MHTASTTLHVSRAERRKRSPGLHLLSSYEAPIVSCDMAELPDTVARPRRTQELFRQLSWWRYARSCRYKRFLPY